MGGVNPSQSKYLTGLQCEKRAWLQCHDPESAASASAATQGLLDLRTEVRVKARLLFPGGVLVGDEAWGHAEAVRRTTSLLRDDSVPAIFEAAFEFNRVRIQIDVLERRWDDCLSLREVKSRKL